MTNVKIYQDEILRLEKQKPELKTQVLDKIDEFIYNSTSSEREDGLIEIKKEIKEIFER